MKIKLAIAAAIGWAMTASAVADNFPSRPIEFVVGFAAGGPADSYARFVANVLKEKIGQPVIVVNRAGAGTIIAAESVVNAKPDGYTMLLGTNTSLVNYDYLYKKRSFDPKKDLLPFHGLINQPPTLVVRGDAPYKTVSEMVDYAKRNPGKINFASVGHGSTPHLLIELFMHEAKVSVTHIPYKGAGPAANDMLSGVVDAIFVYPSVIQGLIDSGKLRSLAVSGSERLAAMPDVPSFGELGLSGVELGTWFIMTLPANTPAPIVERLSRAFDETIKDPAIVDFFKKQGALILPLKGKQLASFLEKQRPVMKELFERAKIQPE